MKFLGGGSRRRPPRPRGLRWWMVLLAIPVVVVLGWIILDLVPGAPGVAGPNPLRRAPGDLVITVPHGGAKHLFPENTVLSYAEMAKRGWLLFEIDLSLTADGILVSHHDLDLRGSVGIDRLVKDSTYEELLAWNFGQNFVDPSGERPYADTEALRRDHPALLASLVPARLDHLLATYPQARFLLELKDKVERSGADHARRAVQALIDTVVAAGAQDRVTISSFDDQLTQALRTMDGDRMLTGAASDDVLVFSVLSALNLDFFAPVAYQALFLPVEDRIYPKQRAVVEKLPAFLRDRLAVYRPEDDTWYTRLVDRRIIADAHRKNLAVYFWTVNDEATMERLIRLGVDGIITDRPDILDAVKSRLSTD